MIKSPYTPRTGGPLSFSEEFLIGPADTAWCWRPVTVPHAMLELRCDLEIIFQPLMRSESMLFWIPQVQFLPCGSPVANHLRPTAVALTEATE